MLCFATSNTFAMRPLHYNCVEFYIRTERIDRTMTPKTKVSTTTRGEVTASSFWTAGNDRRERVSTGGSWYTESSSLSQSVLRLGFTWDRKQFSLIYWGNVEDVSLQLVHVAGAIWIEPLLGRRSFRLRNPFQPYAFSKLDRVTHYNHVMSIRDFSSVNASFYGNQSHTVGGRYINALSIPLSPKITVTPMLCHPSLAQC